MVNQEQLDDSQRVVDARVQPTVDAVRAALTWELDEAAEAKVRDNVEQRLKLGDTLRAYPLANADEPGVVFSPYRTEG